MKILITGACGFVGSALCRYFHAHRPEWQLVGIDNLSRKGSEKNTEPLQSRGVNTIEFTLGRSGVIDFVCDWIIHCAANPNVTAGIGGDCWSVIDDNFTSTKQVLELVKSNKAGFICISTSRVYSIGALLCSWPSNPGIKESFSTDPPLSLYGTTKRMSEMLALEMAGMFGFPCYINRCGLMAGAGQFGHADQGIVSYWIRSWRNKQPLKYFGHRGEVTRDLLHPEDLAALIIKQIERKYEAPIIANVSGGIESSWSLKELSEWCEQRFGPRCIELDPEPRKFDVPWLVLDNTKAKQIYDWKPTLTKHQIWEEIAET